MRTLIILIVLQASSVFAFPVAKLSSTSLVKKAAFEETFTRFPSPYAIIQQFRRMIPTMQYQYSECLKIENFAAVMGVIDPLQGTALEKEPGDLFYQYYQDCALELIGEGFGREETALANSQAILGKSTHEALLKIFAETCKKNPGSMSVCSYSSSSLETQMRAFWYFSGWAAVPAKARLMMIDRFVTYLIGPEPVLIDQGYIGETTAFMQPIITKAKLVEFLSAFLDEQVRTSGTSIYVWEAYAKIAIILRLGPALKN